MGFGWVQWQGFDRLWTNIFRDLLPHDNDSEAGARYDSANGELVVDYHLSVARRGAENNSGYLRHGSGQLPQGRWRLLASHRVRIGPARGSGLGKVSFGFVR